MNKIIFITGGARSGKSSFAEKLAEEIHKNSKNNQKIAYIATGVPIDNEFRQRILVHKKNRKDIFETYEEEIYINKQLKKKLNKHKIFLVECLTTWLGNLYQKKGLNIIKETNNIIENILDLSTDKKKPINNLIKKLEKNEKNKFNSSIKDLLKLKKEDKIIILISNEIGMGIVPDSKLSRDFRDLLGKINQKCANKADLVYFISSGIPTRMK